MLSTRTAQTDVLKNARIHQYYWALNGSFAEADRQVREFENHGGQFIDDGFLGKAVKLNHGTDLILPEKEIFSPEEGALSFWIRPNWDDFGETTSGSHTFLSFSWQEENNAYGVLSDGWWEAHGGQPFTYLIFNNQLKVKMEKRLTYRKGRWRQFLFTWKTGPTGSVKLYADGLLVGESVQPLVSNATLKKGLVIGSDKGAPDSKGRFADCDFDEIKIYGKALTSEEVMNYYLSERSRNTYAAEKKQIRAIFDEGRGWMTREGAVKTIQRIKKAGFNIYTPCVWHGMGSRYPTKVAPQENDEIFFKYDPLARLIEIAEKEGIEVHPWFTVVLRQRDFLHAYVDDGTPAQAFNIHNPNFRKFIVDVILDVCHRYDIGGLNLDFIRSMGFCNSQKCRQDYRIRYARDLLHDVEQYELQGVLSSSLQEWNDQSVEDIVKRVATDGKKMKPDLIISVDGSPRPFYMTPDPQGRNEFSWAEKGYIDIIFNMDYKRNPDLERLEFVRHQMKNSAVLLPLLGNYEKSNQGNIGPRNASTVTTLSRLAVQQFPRGFGLYIYSQFSDSQVEEFSKVYGE